MQNNAFTPVFVFAANTHLSAEDELLTVRQLLRKPNLTAVIGCYKGEEEQSYIVPAADVPNPEFYQFLENNNQECIMFLDNQRCAFLFYKEDGYKHGDKTQFLGTFKEVTSNIAKNSEAYTFIPESNQFFVCR